MNALPDGSADPDEIENDTPPGSAPDRNISSALDRKYSAGPIGLNSAGISSQESSSSSNATELARMKRRTQNESTNVECEVAVEAPNELAPPISRWTRERGFQRLRSDRRLGYPDKEHLATWSRILEQRGMTNSESVYAVLIPPSPLPRALENGAIGLF